MATLDLRAPSISIKFDKGKNLKPIFFYLSPTNTVINLTGYTSRMMARLAYTDLAPITGWSFTTEGSAGSKLSIVTGTATLSDGTLVPGAYGIQLDISAIITAASTFPVALFDIELIDTTGVVLPFIKGTLTPYDEVTK